MSERGQVSILVIGLTYLDSLSSDKNLENFLSNGKFSEKKNSEGAVAEAKSEEHTRKNTEFASDKKVYRFFSESNFNFPSLLPFCEIQKLGILGKL